MSTILGCRYPKWSLIVFDQCLGRIGHVCLPLTYTAVELKAVIFDHLLPRPVCKMTMFTFRLWQPARYRRHAGTTGLPGGSTSNVFPCLAGVGQLRRCSPDWYGATYDHRTFVRCSCIDGNIVTTTTSVCVSAHLLASVDVACTLGSGVDILYC